jgi:hypothetical protein
LWWNIKAHSSQVQFLIRVNTRHYEEYARSLGSSRPQAAKAEYYRSLIFLDNLQEMQIMSLTSLLVMLTLTQKNNESGSKAKQRRTEARARRIAQQPGPSGSPGSSSCTTLLGLYSTVPDRPNVMIFRVFFMQDTSLFSSF